MVWWISIEEDRFHVVPALRYISISIFISMDPGRKAGAKKSIPAQTHMRLVELSMPSILAQTVSVTRISMPESIPFVPSGAVLYRQEHGPQ